MVVAGEDMVVVEEEDMVVGAAAQVVVGMEEAAMEQEEEEAMGAVEAMEEMTAAMAGAEALDDRTEGTDLTKVSQPVLDKMNGLRVEQSHETYTKKYTAAKILSPVSQKPLLISFVISEFVVCFEQCTKFARKGVVFHRTKYFNIIQHKCMYTSACIFYGIILA
mmetsp:Transcript_5951/g.8176  ORF Transcript_5951/g.8176 Transcript_5951/m.8176 type:complete len:164 (+) Transcript_5951:49-540(+)